MRTNGIENITVQNFKAFREAKQFSIDKKHVLIYGPNGSGKSSLYFALYTLFQCSIKSNDKIEKYFNNSGENLLNIYEPGMPSFIEMKTKADQIDRTFKLDISGIQGDNANLKELNLSSEFISHRLLINFYNFRNSKEINLFDVFDRDILPYAVGISHFKTKELGTVVKEIEKKLNGLTFRLWREKNNIENGDLKDLNDEIGLLVKYINDNATNYLNENFKNNDLNIKLTLIGKYIIFKSGKKYHLGSPIYKMAVEQIKADGSVHTVDRPQSFLNEARLTRIGIAIRFCLLPRRPQNVPLKILALDDMLISMDMDNRLDVVETIMNKYQDEYQLFVFTHDKSFYREIKRKIDDKISDWVVYEFKYLNDHRVFFKSGKTELEKAQAFLENQEFESCALELRKLGEIIFRNFLEERGSNIFKVKDYVSFGKMIDETRNLINEVGLQKFQRSVIELELTDDEMNLISVDDISKVQTDNTITPAIRQKIIGARKALFEIAAKTTKENSQALKFVKEVKKIKERILNYGAHPSDEALFKTEMESAVALFEKLKEVLNKV